MYCYKLIIFNNETKLLVALFTNYKKCIIKKRNNKETVKNKKEKNERQNRMIFGRPMKKEKKRKQTKTLSITQTNE